MRNEEFDFLREIIFTPGINNSIVLEWGSGGSTNFIAWYSKKLYSVEHVQTFCQNILQKKITRINILNNKLEYVCVNETNVSNWGRYTDKEKVKSKIYRNYIEIVDKFFPDENYKPDIIYVDGRFRVAATLKGLLLIKNKKLTSTSGFILIHDYTHRRPYHVIEQFLIRNKTVSSLAKFIPRDDIQWDQVNIMYEKYLGVQD